MHVAAHWHASQNAQIKKVKNATTCRSHTLICYTLACGAKVVATTDYFGNHHVHTSCTSRAYCPSWSLFFTTSLTQKRLLHLCLCWHLILIIGRFNRLTGLTKYSLLTVPRPISPVSPALGRRVRGDEVLIQTYMHPIQSSRCSCSTHHSNLKQLMTR